MDAINLMLLKKPVIFNGMECYVTSTYNDSTVDLSDGVGIYPDIKLNELKMAPDANKQGQLEQGDGTFGTLEAY